jgi:hypothetical protein
MSMMEEPPREERKGVVVQMWLVSLGISIFCCAIFSALIAFYIGDLSKTLLSIDVRLASLETRPAPLPPTAMAPPVAPPAPAAPIDVPPAAPAPVPEAPSVTPPGAPAADIPSAAPSGEPAPAPTAEPGAAPAPNVNP